MKMLKIEQLDTYYQTLVNNIIKNRLTVYGIVRHVANSGMSRIISFHIINDGRIININGLLHDLLGESIAKNYTGLKISGCGMDMLFNTVYRFSSLIMPDGFIRDDGTKESNGGYYLESQQI